MLYLTLKHLHITCVIISGLGFFLRGVGAMLDSPLIRQRWVRTVPHVVDTVLLASAISMAVLTAQYPFVQSWLTAKVLGLLVYILCGVMALRQGSSKRSRAVFFVAALATYGYIVSVALRHHPLGFLLELLAPVLY